MEWLKLWNSPYKLPTLSALDAPVLGRRLACAELKYNYGS
jgi:hypothetical protein